MKYLYFQSCVAELALFHIFVPDHCKMRVNFLSNETNKSTTLIRTKSLIDLSQSINLICLPNAQSVNIAGKNEFKFHHIH